MIKYNSESDLVPVTETERRRRVQKVIDLLRSKSDCFDMSVFCQKREGCMTAACVGGYAIIVLEEETEFDYLDAPRRYYGVAEWLGLNRGQVDRFFRPKDFRKGKAAGYTAEVAIRVLEQYRDKGTVNWRKHI